MDFYDYLLELCIEQGTRPSSVAQEIGLSHSAASRWKQGSVPSDATLRRLAAYFDLTYKDFMQRMSPQSQPVEKQEKGPAETAEPKKEDNSLSIEFLQKMAQLTPEQRKLVDSYMSFLLSTQE